MRIRLSDLRRIIKEEVEKGLEEAGETAADLPPMHPKTALAGKGSTGPQDEDDDEPLDEEGAKEVLQTALPDLAAGIASKNMTKADLEAQLADMLDRSKFTLRMKESRRRR
jgi:hypothetical protein